MLKKAVYALAALLILLGLVACGGEPTSSKLEPPSNVRATPDAGFIKLQWKDNSEDETGYFIYREEVGGEASLQALSKIGEVDPDVTSFQDDKVEEEKSYRYAVAVVNATGPTTPVPQSGPAVSPNPPINNNAPFIAFFEATPDQGEPPLEVTFSWSISDSDADRLSCEIDIGDDGSAEYRVEDCSSGEQNHTFETARTYTVSLNVSDGQETTKKTLEVELSASLR